MDEQIYAWDAARNNSFPPKASFRYTPPATYLDPAVGSHYPLPPTFSEDLDGIPGFTVKVAYAVVVNMTMARSASTLWQGVSTYVHLQSLFPCTYELNMDAGAQDAGAVPLHASNTATLRRPISASFTLAVRGVS